MRVVLLAAVTAAALEALSPAPTAAVGQQRPAERQPTELDAVLFAKDVMVPMRDGVRLASDVYRPTFDGVPVSGKLPVLLQQTPYNKEGQGISEAAKYFARHG